MEQALWIVSLEDWLESAIVTAGDRIRITIRIGIGNRGEQCSKRRFASGWREHVALRE